MKRNELVSKVYRLAKDEGCNTSGDIADALKIPMIQAATCVSELIKIGSLRRNGRVISNAGRKYQVFEVIDRPTQEAAE
jgi:hypothetical protein